MFPTHLSVNDLGVFAVAMVFGLIVLLLFMFDFKGRSKSPAIPGEEPSDSEFDPDRFSPENIEQIPSLAYQSFGFAGKRKCPG